MSKTSKIDGVDFHNLEVQKYWQPPASWSDEKRKDEVKNRIFSNEWLGSRKMDGAFYEFIKDMDGNMELIGRSKGVGGDYLDKLEWVPQCHNFFNALPNGTVLIGELVFPENEGSKNTTTIMGCLVEKAIARQEKGPKLHYYVFDTLAYNGQSLLNHMAVNRFGVIDCLRKDFGTESYIDFAEYYRGEDLWNALQEILATGGEGVVITKADSHYEPGKRPSKTCMKVKKELSETVDCIIMGANAPTKEYNGKYLGEWTYWWDEDTNKPLDKKNRYKDYMDGARITPVTKSWYLNWAGSFKIGLYKDGKLIHFGDLSGLTDDMKADWRSYLGKIVEVGGMELFKDTGAIRHPKLIKFRDDKEPKDCTWDQLN